LEEGERGEFVHLRLQVKGAEDGEEKKVLYNRRFCFKWTPNVDTI
jgi:hypothetical protein